MRHATATWAVLTAAALLIAGCGGTAHRRTARGKQCRALVGFEGPITTPLGKEQLTFARLAVANDNADNRTKVRLQASDTRSNPTRAAAISNQLVARSGVLAVIGPATDGEVDAAGPIFARAGIAFMSASATGPRLTAGANPTFFRVVPSEAVEGPQEARFIAGHLHPRAVLIVDDLSAYGRRIADSMIPVFRASRVMVIRASASDRFPATSASVAGRITPAVSALVLAWHSPRVAGRLGRALLHQHKSLTVVGPDRLWAPGEFNVSGAYVASPGPDITALPRDASAVRRIRRSVPSFGIPGPLAYAAAHVVDQAIAGVCRAGHAPSASDVMAAVRRTHEATSILGIPIRFRPDGELADPHWFLFRIDSGGRYHLVP